MTSSKINLLLACAASAIVSSAAQAQVALPTVELRGAGASSVQNVLVQTGNCIGRPGTGLNKLGVKDNTFKTIAPGKYAPAASTSAQPQAASTNPTVDCATSYVIQPNFQMKYISTGSGDGRTMWKNFASAGVLDGSTGQQNPFNATPTNPSEWGNLQFAFSDAPLSAAEKGTYDTNAKPSAGNGIQFPLFVVPITFAYNPVYGKKTTGSTTVDLTFAVKVPGKINNVVAGGLKLSADAYCKIFNGEITNWNDPALKALNSSTSLMNSADVAARWTNEGVPIRLVGRADKSGSTDIFTRALNAQCGSHVTTNKFAKNAESLPFDNTSSIDIRNLDTTSLYYNLSPSSKFAGTIQSLSGLVSDKNGKTCNYTELTSGICNTGTTTTEFATASGNTINNYAGLFLVASGSGNVAAAILGNGSNSNVLLPSTYDSTITLNGRFGYVSSDNVVPAPSKLLHSAALQQGGTGLTYKMPTPADALKAFGSALPPETTSASGAYDATDGRTLGSVDPFKAIDSVTNPATAVDRANPVHWGAVIYNPNTSANLANPTLGYPLTGVTFMLTSTCFKPETGANPNVNAKRFGIVEMISLAFGQVTKDSSNFALSANTFKGTGTTVLGVITQANLGLVPTAWQNAIKDSFLKKPSSTTLAAKQLWIQDSLPTTASDLDATAAASDSHDNPTCPAGLGA